MNHEHLLDDIRELNLAYLLLVQRLINADRKTAIFRLQMDEQTADILSQTSVTELARMAQCNQLICHFAIHDTDQLHALLNAGAGAEMRQIHAAILLGSKSAQRTVDRIRTSACGQLAQPVGKPAQWQVAAARDPA